MTAHTTVSLYTEEYYNTNKAEIDNASYCGNIVEMIEISNYIYVSIKATQYTVLDDDFRTIPADMNEAIIQSDLTSLRAGTFNRYEMIVEQYLQVKEMQLADGDQYDPYTFERWHDGTRGRWRLILTRENTNALSIKVLNDNGGYWYTPGAFINQGDGTWLINSWVADDSTNKQVNYVFISGAAEISQTLQIPGTVDSFDSHIAYN